jgi:general secretion pathway protein A
MGRGFLALIAQPGMGKTTVLFRLLERLRKSTYTAFLFQTQCDSQEFLRSLVTDMGIDSRGHDLVQMREELNEALVRLKRADRRFVLVIDEAQNLDDSVLETVRLLSDFETPSAKLMQIIIAGQPQLATKLARPALIQFRQRVAVLCRLEPFSPAETDRYIEDRLQVAGYDGGPLFTADARAIIAERSRGIPRNINNLCFNALSMGYALKRQRIDREIVLEVLEDLDLESLIAEGDDAPRTDSPGSPTEPPRAFGSKWRGELGGRPFRATALAASLVLASLFLFPSVRKLFVTQFDRVFSFTVMPLAKTLGLIRPIPPPTVSPTIPVHQIAIAEPAARGTVPFGNPTVVVEVKPSQTLEQISVSHIGRFDKKLLQEIRALNPQIKDINHLEAGQRIVLPGRTPTSPGTGSAGRANVEPMTSARN